MRDLDQDDAEVPSGRLPRAVSFHAAAHDRPAPRALAARLVCQHAHRIGLPGLLGAVRGAG